MRIEPLTINCQKDSKFIILMPLSKLSITSALMMAPGMVPTPSIKFVPTITHAAIASSSYIVPAPTVAALMRAVKANSAIAA